MSGSFVEVPSVLIDKRARDKLAWLKERKKKALDRILRDEKQRLHNSWFRKLLQQPVPSDRKIVESMEADPDSHWNETKAYYDGPEASINKIIMLASLSERIMISGEDLETIS